MDLVAVVAQPRTGQEVNEIAELKCRSVAIYCEIHICVDATNQLLRVSYESNVFVT